MKKIFTIAIASSALLLAASCAKTISTGTNENAQRFLEAWMDINYKGLQPNEDGIYIINDTEGDGALIDDSTYVFIECITRNIPSLEIVESTNAETAQQLGTYDCTYYYGSKILYTADNNLAAGTEAALKGMKVGGERTVVIPRWMNTSSRFDTIEEYLKSDKGGSADYIYEIKVTNAVDSIQRWQNGLIDEYVEKNYGKDAVTYSDDYLRYIQLQEPTDTTAFPSDTTFYINYTGRLLNGQVFDTTIADTAKVHNIYSASKTYSPVKITWASTASEIQLSSSTVIAGFYTTLWQMRHYEKGVGIFNSDYGYSSSGSGSTIPAYAPLIFEVEQVDEPDE